VDALLACFFILDLMRTPLGWGTALAHRAALKERQGLPVEVGIVFAEVGETLVAVDVRVPELTLKREQGWGKRTILVSEARHLGATYRMAWEVISRAEVVIWAYGSHEGFYRRLKRRAKQ
jgi:hypothetical protein